MKKIFCWLLVFLIFLQFNTRVKAISASSYVLLDPVTNGVISAKNEHERRSMASTTKIMTAILLIEQGNLEENVKVTKEMIMVEGTSIVLMEGDIIPKINLLYGLMLESGNDAANAIALSVSKNFDDFASLMNNKAQSLNMKNSSFVTPSGLDDENHYTTAYDMALLAGYAMKNEIFEKVVSTKEYKSIYNDGATTRTYYNHNRLLRELDGCNGIKTGFTKKSGRCLVSSCKRESGQLIAVTLNAPSDWADHKTLYEYGFSQMQSITLKKELPKIKVVGSYKKQINISCEQINIAIPKSVGSEITSIIELPPFVYAPIKKGQKVGRITYYFKDRIIGEANIFTSGKAQYKQIEKKGILTQLINWFIMLFK